MSRRAALLLSRARGRLWAALREDGRIVAVDVEDPGAAVGRGRIVRGRVRRVVPGLEAAFVDLDSGASGFLPGDEAWIDGEPPKPGRVLVVQVRRVPRADKVAELTTRIQLVGRYLVLDPTRSRRGVSRRVREPQARERLRSLVEDLEGASLGGWIARAVAQSAEVSAVRDEATRLLGLWREIRGRAAEAGPPALLSPEPDLLERALRDAPAGTDVEELLVDDVDLRVAVLDRLGAAPDLVGRMRLQLGAGRLYEDEIRPAVVEALAPRVALPSGGVLTIEETTALVAVDVDSGSGRPEEANREAAREIPRQLRLRDLGGAVVIDWVSSRDRRALEAAVEAFSVELARDPARTRIVGLSDLALLEMTRERLGPGLGSVLERACPRCGGRSRVREPQL